MRPRSAATRWQAAASATGSAIMRLQRANHLSMGINRVECQLRTPRSSGASEVWGHTSVWGVWGADKCGGTERRGREVWDGRLKDDEVECACDGEGGRDTRMTS